MSLVNTTVPPFRVHAYQDGAFLEVTDDDLRGQWSVLVFYPGDFTFVCPTELEDLADRYDEFRALGVEVYGASTDSHFAHKAWHASSAAVGKVRYPLLADPTLRLSRAFDVLVEEDGQALRGTFVIDPEGTIRTVEVHDAGIGRDAAELLRKVRAAQYITAHPGEVCPARWDDGADTLTPSLELVGRI
ncbi:alkyl hydroperoxide reductase subunit C [Nocardioides sp. BYT-33-1]|uniref:alkyl hydroperoxide reductase subunit C n=1 Tax=Nocardioides sp. BYT-33-1 TaxID=3416952 RepID=UPI003F53816B